jgi:chemotaxis protein methyltransferase CheR
MVLRLPQLTDGQFKKFSELVYEKTGIYLKPEKKELLNARLGKRLRACKIASFSDYFDLVIRDRSGKELVNLINSVSTNFTNFFREQAHFDLLTSLVLPQFLQAGQGEKRKLNIWSAACSSGEEPYTIAMVLEEFFAKNRSQAVDYRILATDISTRVLDQAKKGVYTEERVSKVPPEYLRNYFQKGVRNAVGYVKVKDCIRNRIRFERFNLMDEFPWQEAMDVVFCRNVMIYFNTETQENLVGKFHRCLLDGGFLFIGHSESLTRLRHHFTQVATTAYRK